MRKAYRGDLQCVDAMVSCQSMLVASASMPVDKCTQLYAHRQLPCRQCHGVAALAAKGFGSSEDTMMAMHFHLWYGEQAELHACERWHVGSGSTAPAFWQQPVGLGNCVTRNVALLQAGCNCDDAEAAWFCRKTCGLCQQAGRQMSDGDIRSR